jgi:hypothetical protein
MIETPARFTIPKNKDMRKRISAMRKTPLYTRKTKASIVGYGVGNEDGRRAAITFMRSLLARRPPTDYGRDLGRLLITAAGLPGGCTGESVEESYRHGWLVGLGFSLECLLYDLAKARLDR